METATNPIATLRLPCEVNSGLPRTRPATEAFLDHSSHLRSAPYERAQPGGSLQNQRAMVAIKRLFQMQNQWQIRNTCYLDLYGASHSMPPGKRKSTFFATLLLTCLIRQL